MQEREGTRRGAAAVTRGAGKARARGGGAATERARRRQNPSHAPLRSTPRERAPAPGAHDATALADRRAPARRRHPGVVCAAGRCPVRGGRGEGWNRQASIARESPTPTATSSPGPHPMHLCDPGSPPSSSCWPELSACSLSDDSPSAGPEVSTVSGRRARRHDAALPHPRPRPITRRMMGRPPRPTARVCGTRISLAA